MRNILFVGRVRFPYRHGLNVNMMPFLLGDSRSIPKSLHGYLPMITACNLEQEQYGKICYLSVMETVVSSGSQRRPGIHTDRHPKGRWGGPQPGWGGGGSKPKQDGIYLASTVNNSCRAWDVHIENPGPMGDCESHRFKLESTPEIRLVRNGLYWITDSCPHESLPVTPGTYRQWFRLVTHKVDLWYADHSTPNPTGVIASCPIIHGNKFAA